MTDAPRLAAYVDAWRAAIETFVALARDISEAEAATPTDLEGWTVKDVIAHTAHLEAVLAGASEETIDVPEAPHIKGPMGLYTEQGVLARRERDLAALADEIERSAALRAAELEVNPPTDGAARPPRTPGGVPWDYQTLLSNRPLDVWMHEQDVRRALHRPGSWDHPAARHAVAVFGRALPMVVGKRVAPPVATTVQVDVPEFHQSWTVTVRDDGRAAAVQQVPEPTVRITLTAEDFIVRAGGRRGVEALRPAYTGDADLGARVLEHLAVTP